jgi:hypothetical protein
LVLVFCFIEIEVFVSCCKKRLVEKRRRRGRRKGADGGIKDWGFGV